VTPQEELKRITSDIELLEAELYSNIEEITQINPLTGLIRRETYLKIRNNRLEEDLKEMRTKRKSLIDHLNWDRNTELLRKKNNQG
jgi:hypothetical protein